MGKRGKRVLCILGLIAVGIAVCVAAFLGYYEGNERKAVQIAKGYLEQKYEQEMIYQGVRHAWIDPELYHVTFTSVETDVTFQVSIWPPVLRQTSTEVEDGIWDDYLWCFFCKETEALLQPEAASIWNEFDRILITHSRIRNSKATLSTEINEHMSAREMERTYYAYAYDLFVTPGRMISRGSEREEAQNILKLFQMLRDKDYHPSWILVWYQTSTANDSDSVTTEKPVTFESWETIDTVEQVLEIMREQLTLEDGTDAAQAA